MVDPLLMGNNMAALQATAEGYRVEKEYHGDGADAAVRVIQDYNCLKASIESLVIPWMTSFGEPYADCVLRKLSVADTEIGTVARVSFIYENPAAYVQGGQVEVGETLWEIDCSLRQVPLEQAHPFKEAIVAGGIAPKDLANIKAFFDGRAVMAFLDEGTDKLLVLDDPVGETVKFALLNDDGLDVTICELAGAEGVVYTDPGTARELFLEKLRGRETIDILATVIRCTVGRPADDFDDAVANTNALQYPNPPGGITTPYDEAQYWKRSETRIVRRGSVREESISWELNQDQWSQRYHVILANFTP